MNKYIVKYKSLFQKFPILTCGDCWFGVYSLLRGVFIIIFHVLPPRLTATNSARMKVVFLFSTSTSCPREGAHHGAKCHSFSWPSSCGLPQIEHFYPVVLDPGQFASTLSRNPLRRVVQVEAGLPGQFAKSATSCHKVQ